MKTIVTSFVLLLISITFLSPFFLKAQEYKAIRTQGESYFLNAISSDIIAIRIDSVVSEGDLVYYYGFRQLRPADSSCWTVNGNSWLGQQVFEKADGSFNFAIYPLATDSSGIFSIKGLAGPGDTWQIYKYRYSPDYLEATLTQTYYSDFLGLSDSVKEISLQRKDESGNIVIDPINNEVLLLSKNYGLIRLPRFDTFEGAAYFYDIYGFTNPAAGETNLTFAEVYNYEIGDEFHILYNEMTPQYRNTTISTIRIVTDKEVFSSSDSIRYTYQECRSESVSFPLSDSNQVSYSSGIRAETIHFNQLNNAGMACMPLETIIDSAYAPFRAYSSRMYLFNGHAVRSFDDQNTALIAQDNCWTYPVFSGCPIEQQYISGLGGPYYWCYDGGFTHIQNQLVYYKKGSEIWGSPMDCDSLQQVGIAERVKQESITIFPNPTSGTVSIVLPDEISLPASMQIFDLSGRLISRLILTQLHQIIDLVDLTPAVYAYRIIDRNGEVFAGKIRR